MSGQYSECLIYLVRLGGFKAYLHKSKRKMVGVIGEDAVKNTEDTDLILVDAVLYEHVLDVCVVLSGGR